MTPQITILALAIIAAALSVIAALQRVYINRLKTDATYARYKAEKQSEHYEELLTEAKAEADNEYQLRRQAEKNLAEANEAIMDWRWDANKYKAALSKYFRQRDSKTGRFYSAKPRPTVQEMERGLAEFDAMMGNAMEQLQGLTIR
jgi:hypothetical protein